MKKVILILMVLTLATFAEGQDFAKERLKKSPRHHDWLGARLIITKLEFGRTPTHGFGRRFSQYVPRPWKTTSESLIATIAEALIAPRHFLRTTVESVAAGSAAVDSEASDSIAAGVNCGFGVFRAHPRIRSRNNPSDRARACTPAAVNVSARCRSENGIAYAFTSRSSGAAIRRPEDTKPTVRTASAV